MKMNSFLNKPYILFWLSIPIFLLLGAAAFQCSVDMQIASSYFVFSPLHLGIVLGLLAMFVGGLYFLFRNLKLNPRLNAFHTKSSLFILLLFMVFINIKCMNVIGFSEIPVNSLFGISFFILFLLVQCVLIFNLIKSIQK
jgi:hypothetical protein